MYSGALIMFAGIPLAMASWWGLVPVALLAAAIVWRLTDEERFLARNLAGYDGVSRQGVCSADPGRVVTLPDGALRSIAVRPPPNGAVPANGDTPSGASRMHARSHSRSRR